MQQDIIICCTQSLADTNLTRTLCYRHQHNIHNTDTADQKANRRNAAQKYRNIISRRQHGFHNLRHVAHGKIIVSALFNLVTCTQHLFYIGLHIINNVFILSLYRDPLYICNTHHTVLCRCQRNINHVILIHAHAALTLAFQNPNNLKRRLIDTHNLAHRVALREQTVSNSLTDNCHPTAAYKVTLAQNASVLNLQTGNGEVAGRCTFDTAGPVLVTCNHLIASVDTGRNVGNTINLLLDSLHIIIRQLNAFSRCQTRTGRGTASRSNNQQVTSQL